MDGILSRRALLTAGLGSLCAIAPAGSAEPDLPACGNPDQLLREARERFAAAKESLQAEFRAALVRALPLADRVEAFLLDFEPSLEPGGDPFDESGATFPILPYRKATKVLKRLTVKGPDAADLQRLMAATLKKGDAGGAAACHFPIHGLQFFKGDSQLYATSLCWKCANYYVQYPDEYDTAQWLGMQNPDLEKLMNKILPVPESELKRFREKFASGK
jgi:hypothetical protein